MDEFHDTNEDIDVNVSQNEAQGSAQNLNEEVNNSIEEVNQQINEEKAAETNNEDEKLMDIRLRELKNKSLKIRNLELINQLKGEEEELDRRIAELEAELKKATINSQPINFRSMPTTNSGAPLTSTAIKQRLPYVRPVTQPSIQTAITDNKIIPQMSLVNNEVMTLAVSRIVDFVQKGQQSKADSKPLDFQSVRTTNSGATHVSTYIIQTLIKLIDHRSYRPDSNTNKSHKSQNRNSGQPNDNRQNDQNCERRARVIICWNCCGNGHRSSRCPSPRDPEEVAQRRKEFFNLQARRNRNRDSSQDKGDVLAIMLNETPVVDQID